MRHKITPPTRVIQWLGIVLDMDMKTLTIPRGKVEQILKEFQQLEEKTHMNRRQVQSVTGKINHLAKACRPARLFMSRILAYLRGHPKHRRPISTGTRADLKWFLNYLPSFNGVMTIPSPAPTMIIEVDSCMMGGGRAQPDPVLLLRVLTAGPRGQAHIPIRSAKCHGSGKSLCGQTTQGPINTDPL